MNGLAAITPKGFQTPSQNQGLGQLMGGQRPSAREQMAIEVVNDDIEPLNLDPKLEAALKLGEAKELLQSANQVLAPNPANVVQQLQQEIPAGIAALTAQMQGRPQMAPQGMPRPMPKPGPGPRPMAPGIMGMAQQMAAANQQGRQAPMPQRPPMPMQNAPQRAPAPRPPMGGLPQLPSNLPRAAQGGIVAFNDGGFPDLSGDGKVTRKDILMGRGVVSKAAGGYVSEVDSYMSAQAVLSNPNSTDQEKAFARATLDSLRPIQQGGNMTMDQYAAMMQEVNRRQQGGMADGGVVGFAGPGGSLVEEEEEERFIDFTEYPPRGLIPDEVEEVSEEVIEYRPRVEVPDFRGQTEEEREALEIAMGLAQGDEKAMMREAGESFDEAVGLEDYRTAQREAEQTRKALREARFTPEEERRRLLRAGLLGTAKEGLGGFARGTMTEEDRIYAEQLEGAQEDVATMDKITDTFQQLGMSKLEAERSAQKLVRDGINSGLSSAASLLNAQRQAETAYDQMVTQTGTTQRGQDIQVDVARLYAARGSETNERSFVEDYVAAALAQDPTANEAQLRTDAVREYKQMTALITASGREASEVYELYADAAEQFDRNTGMARSLSGFQNTPLGQEFFDPNTSARRKEAIRFEFIQNYVQGAQRLAPRSGAGAGAGGGEGGRNQPIVLPDNFKDYDSLIPNQQYLVKDVNGDMVLVRWDSINRAFNEI